MDKPDLLYGKATILVVDDIPDNLILMSDLLKRHYQVKIANCGEKALKIAMSNTPPDLILLDIMMPGMDGYEVCRQLKSTPKTMNIPVIFVTAKTEVEDEQKGLELGAIDFITKPVSPPVIMARVKNHLALKAMVDYLRDQSGWGSAERLAHTLKSISNDACMRQLAEKIEAAITQRRPGVEVDGRHDAPPAQIESLIAQLDMKLPEGQGKTMTAPDLEKLKAIFDRLEALLLENDSEAIDVLDANAEFLDAAFPGYARNIDSAIRSFDYETALAALRTAIGTPAADYSTSRRHS